ncbi:MAG: ABC transporter substrate-binding protein [Sphingomonadaceae bacterium]
MRHFLPALLLVPLLLTGGCGQTTDDSPLSVSVIGTTPEVADPNRNRLGAPDAALISAVAQGLVRYDASGQIEAGLAIRWAISEDGLYYTFRLAAIEGLDADLVAKRLRATIARRSDNSLKSILGAIDEIVAVTPQVVEIRLRAARPNLLDLLAQPEMAIIDKKIATGPLIIAREQGRLLYLQPKPSEDDDPESAAEIGRRSVLLRGERAALAVARFATGEADLVLAGSFDDLPIARAANPRPRDLRFDPVAGLFGLAAVDRNGFIGNSENRRALAMAVDRDRIASAFGLSSSSIVTSVVAPGTTELPQPSQPGWSGRDLGVRRQDAAATVRVWKITHPDADAHVRISLPSGPGSHLLFAMLKADFAAIGVESERVAMSEDADLRLIDEVVPAQMATWYLRKFTCDHNPVCSDAADTALKLAREASHPIERAARIADADLRLTELVPYIPIAQPLRWSLVAPRVTEFVANNRGVHPLNHLVADTR